jgi:Mg-chelatase subunit ChlD
MTSAASSRRSNQDANRRTARLTTLLAAALTSVTVGCNQPAVSSDRTDNEGVRGGTGGVSGGSSAQGSGGSSGQMGGGIKLPDAGASSAMDAVGAVPGMNQCAAEAHDGKMVPLDLLFMVDISGSMGDLAGDKTKWVAVRDALVAFLKDNRSAGLGVGLHFFPPPAKRCTNSAECTGGFNDECEERGLCTVGTTINQMANTCNAAEEKTCFGFGANGLTCTSVGQCAKTGLYCTGIGTPCAGGMAGDTCQARPKICLANSASLCNATFYATPTVTFADLPGNEPMLTTALMDVVPNGSTPTAAAVEGAIRHLSTRAMADATRKPVLVLATDGLPQGCLPANTITAAAGHLAAGFAGQMGAAGIPTYVIGVFNDRELAQANPALMQLATAGGTMTPFVLTAGQDLGQRFIDTLNQIRGQALGCEFMIPMPKMGLIDYRKVNVRMTAAAGAEDLVYVGSADKCDPNRGGWHYDADPASGGTPTRVRLCEASCKKVKAEAAARVELLFGCVTKID